MGPARAIAGEELDTSGLAEGEERVAPRGCAGWALGAAVSCQPQPCQLVFLSCPVLPHFKVPNHPLSLSPGCVVSVVLSLRLPVCRVLVPSLCHLSQLPFGSYNLTVYSHHSPRVSQGPF